MMFLVSVFWIWFLQPTPQSVADEAPLFEQAKEQEAKYFGEEEAMKSIVPFIPVEERQIECLATNIYHEARNESRAGRLAVGMVVMNRVESSRFPNTVCEVIYDGRISKWHRENTGKVVPLRNQCQFSWWCDGKSDRIYNHKKFEEARMDAITILMNDNIADITDGALWYHADYVNPSWSKVYKKTAKIGTHIFYKEK